MAYSNFRNGFAIQTSAAIDQRIYLTKAQMLTAEDDYVLPEVYFCICPEDGKFYIYSEDNTEDPVTGKYRTLESMLDFSDPTFVNHFNTALQNSQTLMGLLNRVAALETTVGDANSGLVHDVAELRSDISSITVNGGEVVIP